MQHIWLQKSDKENFITNQQFLKNYLITDTYDKKKHAVCFSHVPKTGGTSLETILYKNYLASEVLHINAPDLNQQPQVLNLKKHPPKVICGHHPMHGILYQLLPEQPIFHFTQLRHPVDRVLSYFNYVLGKTDHPMHQHAKGQSLQAFIQSAPSPEISDGQCKRFSGYLHQQHSDGEGLFSLAKTTLESCFSLVLTTCLFDEGLLLLKNRLNLSDVYYQRHNVSQAFMSKAEISDATMATILENNAADLLLFEWARTRCQSLIDAELSQSEVSEFRTKNQQWAQLINT